MNNYFYTAASLAAEAGRISQALTTKIVEKTREVGVPGHLYDHAEEKMDDIPNLLDSKFDKDKIDALKRLIALVTKGYNVRKYFADVIKNVASTSFEVRKLVYIYLLRYAEEEPDLVLLSINTFQKDLADRNSLIRAMALRVMSSIRVPLIVPLVMMALKKGAADLSPYVRKAACNSIPKVYELDKNQKELLIELVMTFLNDKSTVVLGTAVCTLNQICPTRYDLIHAHFKKLCHLLPETDDWGQIQILILMQRYARVHFTNPAVSTPAPDHQLLLDASKQLLCSLNSGVVLSAALLHYNIGKIDDSSIYTRAIINLLSRSAQEVYSVLMVILTMTKMHPSLFSAYYSNFAVYDGDPHAIIDIKLELLQLLADEKNLGWIMREFRAYSSSSDVILAQKCIKTLGRLAHRLPVATSEALEYLMSITKSHQHDLIGESIIVIRRLLSFTHSTVKESHTPLVQFLLLSYSEITSSMAKASIIWLIAHNIDHLFELAPDALRLGTKHFIEEESIVKLHILNLAIVMLIHSLKTNDPLLQYIQQCFDYVTKVASYDMDILVRDRSRLLSSFSSILNSSTSKHDLLISIFQGTNAISVPSPLIEADMEHDCGSLSQAVHVQVKGYIALSDWASVVLNQPERDVKEEWTKDVVHSAVLTPIKTRAKKRVIALDEFYKESESESSESSQDEDESSEDS